MARDAYRPEIDGLRAVAVILVLLFHAFPHEVGGGFVGVDVFFVISGYLITGVIMRSADKGKFSFIEFYYRRCKRLLPALVTVLICTGVLGLLILLPTELNGLGKHLEFSSLFLENFVLLSESGYFDHESFRKPLMHLWSLGVEEQFYIFWPFLLILSAKRDWALRTSLTLMGASFVFSLFYFETNPVTSFYMLPSRLWELMCGATLLLVERRDRPARCLVFLAPAGRQCSVRNKAQSIGAELAAITALICLVTFSFLASGTSLFFGAWGAIPCLTATVLIAIGPRSSVNRYILGSSVAAWFGRISYPLYLWHWPLLSLMLTADDGKTSYMLRGTALLLAVLLAWLTHVIVELPIKRFKLPGSRIGFASAFALFLPALFGAALVTQPNFFERTSWAPKIAVRNDIDGVSAMNVIDRDWWSNHTQNNDKSCLGSNWLGSAIPDYCRLTNDAPRLAIVGDSHANHLVPGLIALGDPDLSQLVQISFGGCVGLVGAYFAQSYQPQSILRNCNSANERFFDQIKVTKSIQLVIISMLARSADEFDGKGSPLRVYSKIFDGRQLHSVGISLVHDAISETVSFFEAAGKRVVFVADVPDLRIDPVACLRVRSVTFSRRSVDNCGRPKSEIFDEQQPNHLFLESLAAKHPNLRVFDSKAVFCDDVFCSAIRGGKMLYRDSTHLSLDGSILWAKSFQEWLHNQNW